jgi:hypothetical protein
LLPVPTDEAVKIAQTYGLWIQTGAILASAIAALLLILWTKKVACRRATLDLIMIEQTNRGHIRDRQQFIRLRDAGNLVHWAMVAQAASRETAIIRATLNRYELVAIGIFEGTLDNTIYYRWCRTTLVRDWIACKPFVTQLRHGNNAAYFCEFEKLAKKWASRDEKPHV